MIRPLFTLSALAMLAACTSAPMAMNAAGGGINAAATAPVIERAAPASTAAVNAAAVAAARLAAPKAMDYVARAAEGDLYQQQAGQLAQQRAARPEVRTLGQMMVADHAQTSAELMAAARQAGLNPSPPALGAAATARMAALRAAPAGGFDGLYLSQQVRVDEEALALQSTYALGGDNARLQAAAQAVLPVVRGHLDRAEALAAAGG